MGFAGWYVHFSLFTLVLIFSFMGICGGLKWGKEWQSAHSLWVDGSFRVTPNYGDTFFSKNLERYWIVCVIHTAEAFCLQHLNHARSLTYSIKLAHQASKSKYVRKTIRFLYSFQSFPGAISGTHCMNSSSAKKPNTILWIINPPNIMGLK